MVYIQKKGGENRNNAYDNMKKDIPLISSEGMSKRENCTISLSQNDCDLQRTTEVLREKLVQLFFSEGSFTSPSVLEISLQLDDCIVATQKNNSTYQISLSQG